MKDFKFNGKPLFGVGKEKDETFWNTIYRQAILNGLLDKEIENYGILKSTKKGADFIKSPFPIQVPINHNYATVIVDYESSSSKSGVLDELLVKMLKDLRRAEAKRLNVPPFIIFQDPSIEDMATQYPISLADMNNISGVSKGKAARYAKPFVELIKEYVEENDIDRPTEFVVKQVANKSKVKVTIIQGIDRKIPLNDIAESSHISMEELLQELDAIVSAGTKLNLDYYIEDNVDEYSKDDIYDYFMEADSDSIEDAFKELQEDDITMEEIQLMRIKFLSEMGN